VDLMLDCIEAYKDNADVVRRPTNALANIISKGTDGSFAHVCVRVCVCVCVCVRV